MGETVLTEDTHVARDIRFQIKWINVSEGVQYATLAAISILVDDLVVWPVFGEPNTPLEWFADEFLSHLVECWKPLLLRQTYPINVYPLRPALLRAEAAKRWSNMPDKVVENEDSLVTAFEEVHNLTNAFAGVSGLPDLWFFRERERVIIDSGSNNSNLSRLWVVYWRRAVDALTRAGDEIALRLEETNPEKWGSLVQAWRNRDVGDEIRVLQLAMGLDFDTVQKLLKDRLLSPPGTVSQAANDEDEIWIAARTAGPVPSLLMRQIISLIRGSNHIDSPKLREIGHAAIQHLDQTNSLGRRPYEQGSAAAKWLRDHLNWASSSRISPLQILRELSVPTRVVNIPVNYLDAIAVWGQQHGPAVIINRKSRRFLPSRKGYSTERQFAEQGAVRATIAHELCHLLLDTEHTLSVVEVLGNRMPLWIEQRARAFAAELLVPEIEARLIWEKEPARFSEPGIRRALRRIQHTFGVTTSLAAWKLDEAIGVEYRQEIRNILARIIPEHQRVFDSNFH